MPRYDESRDEPRRRQSGPPVQIDLLVRDNRLIVVVGDDEGPETQNAFVWSKRENDGGWRHFTFTRRGSAVELFLDGASQGTGVALHSGGPITTDRRALGCDRLWAENNDRRWGNASFQGGLDEVCVFSRALAPAEIQALAERRMQAFECPSLTLRDFSGRTGHTVVRTKTSAAWAQV